ncbi:hypothetical protein L195_g044387 [Trifolium pratense]|uniref:Uncharacterized protein n=1 Tax=Trifolium pratense TaxID=57577 RepID=A0A2K3MBX0_TRIPR|nr:hypothetical protein L195_g044387 [Trifolium pratense]
MLTYGLTNTAATHLSPIWSHNCDVACVGGGAIDWVGVATPPLTSAVHVWLFRSTHWAASHLLSSIDISSDGVGRIGTHKQVYFLFDPDSSRPGLTFTVRKSFVRGCSVLTVVVDHRANKLADLFGDSGVLSTID